MDFTINTWSYIAPIVYIMMLIGWFVFSTKIIFTNKIYLGIISLLMIFPLIYCSGMMLMLMGASSKSTDDIKSGNIKILINNYNNYDEKKYDRNIEICKNLKNVNDEITDYTNNESNYDYYFDYLNLKLIYKKIGICDLYKYLNSSANKDLIYSSGFEINKITERLKLSGVLKTTIDNGQPKYLIDNYVLDDDDNKKMASLANNQSVELDIAYNKEEYKGDKHISKYVIVNADTN